MNFSMTKFRPIGGAASMGGQELALGLVCPFDFCILSAFLDACLKHLFVSHSPSPHTAFKYSPSVSKFCLLLAIKSFLIHSIHYWGIPEFNGRVLLTTLCNQFECLNHLEVMLYIMEPLMSDQSTKKNTGRKDHVPKGQWQFGTRALHRPCPEGHLAKPGTSCSIKAGARKSLTYLLVARIP